MRCYDMLCYAMLCCAVLCYAMLCYAMLCYASTYIIMPVYDKSCSLSQRVDATLIRRSCMDAKTRTYMSYTYTYAPGTCAPVSLTLRSKSGRQFQCPLPRGKGCALHGQSSPLSAVIHTLWIDARVRVHAQALIDTSAQAYASACADCIT